MMKKKKREKKEISFFDSCMSRALSEFEYRAGVHFSYLLDFVPSHPSHLPTRSILVAIDKTDSYYMELKQRVAKRKWKEIRERERE
jgi:hypothetical protein